MKPYLRVIFNWIKLSTMKLRRKRLNFYPVQLWGWNTKFVFRSNAIIRLGRHIVSDGRCVIMADTDSELSIGNGVYFNDGAMISCKSKVTIGDGCRFGPNVKLFDNNHKYDSVHGVKDQYISKPISIGKNCWIASNCVILKGTQIGDNCVIGAGVIVKGTIPASSIVTVSQDYHIRAIEDK